MPHPPDFSPLWALTCWLRTRWSWQSASLILLSSNLLSDLLLGGWQNFGQWTWFTYSALLSTLVVLSPATAKYGIAAVGAALWFWFWTNMGVWLTTLYYPHSLIGLANCFIAALPFLNNSMLATLLTYVILRQAEVSATYTGTKALDKIQAFG